MGIGLKRIIDAERCIRGRLYPAPPGHLMSFWEAKLQPDLLKEAVDSLARHIWQSAPKPVARPPPVGLLQAIALHRAITDTLMDGSGTEYIVMPITNTENGTKWMFCAIIPFVMNMGTRPSSKIACRLSEKAQAAWRRLMRQYVQNTWLPKQPAHIRALLERRREELGGEPIRPTPFGLPSARTTSTTSSRARS
eukprot:2856556-Prymnesium_polylepis.1